MTEVPRRLRFLSIAGEDRKETAGLRVGVVEGAIGGADRFASLAALFPHARFERTGPAWPSPETGSLDVLIVPAAASQVMEVERTVRALRACPPGLQVVVILRDADVVTTRQLLRDGAADVLPAPASEPSLAVSLERLLAGRKGSGESPRSGEVVAFLKAGGGVGATTLATQTAIMIARRAGAESRVCLADLDLQFGAANLVLDLAEVLTVTDCLAAGGALEETDFANVLSRHRSGLRVLAAPRELTPLESLSPALADSLITGLRRAYALTILDLPSVWTAWTNRALQLADRIVLVTQLTVPHSHLVRRQLSVLNAQGLQDRPLTLVCNAVSSDQQSVVSVRAIENALGRPFDVVVPEDRKTILAAINEGVELSAVRRSTKTERAISELANAISARALSERR